MSIATPYIGTQLLAAAREYGVRRVVDIISRFSVFLFPFVFWMIIYFLAGGFFAFVWPWSLFIIVPGFIFLILELVMGFAYFSVAIDLPKTFMLKIQDTSVDERNHAPLAKSFSNFVMFGPLSFYFPLRYMLLSGILEMIASYSLVTVFVINKDVLARTLAPMLGLISQAFPLQLSIPNLTIILFCLFVLSVYSTVGSLLFRLLKFCKENGINPPKGTRLYISISYFALPTRCLMLIVVLYKAMYSLSEDRPFYAVYVPFIVSSDIRNIVQKSFQNTQGKNCRFVDYKYELKTNEEVEALKSVTREHFGLESFIHEIKPAEAKKLIADTEPILYLGFVEKQFVFFGVTCYSPSKKIRVASFFFNNRYIRDDFEAIMQKEISKAHEI